MNATQNNDQNTTNANATVNGGQAAISWLTKAKYMGTGFVIGVMVAPLVRQIIEKMKPKIDGVFEGLVGTTEGYVEQASDLLFRAKEHLHKHGEPEHEHNHEHAKPKSKVKSTGKASDIASSEVSV